MDQDEGNARTRAAEEIPEPRAAEPSAPSEAASSTPAATATGLQLPAAIAETHCAVVIFVGDRAYKVKKPVDLGFLDFRTVEAREAVCRRELELNRRLAPDVYLDLEQLVDGTGATRDWIVVMRRMPSDRRLSTLVSDGVDVRGDVRQVARVLASFHARASTSPEVAAAGRASALRRRWTDNFDESLRFAGRVLDRDEFDEIVYLALRFVDGRGSLLDERVRSGCVVDGHGDVLADDIFCLPDGPRLLDCLEFDDALRYVDGLDDAAFLAMDLEHLGAPELAEQFLGWYQEFAGTPVAPSLAHHYIAYRAFVRAKVACLHWEQGAASELARARQLARLTLDHLRTAHVRVVLVGGLPGTGKSTVAGGLADRMGAVLLRTDQIRRELPGAAGLDPHGGYGRGLYDRRQVQDTYDELLARARALVEHGESVVLDATWSDPDQRRAARAMAERTATCLVELRCTAPEAVTIPRIRTRTNDTDDTDDTDSNDSSDDTGDLSDATEDVAARMGAHFATWPEATAVDTSGLAETAVAAAWEITAAQRT